MDDEELARLRKAGNSLRQIGILLSVSYETVRKRLKRLGSGTPSSTVNPVNLCQPSVSTKVKGRTASDRLSSVVLKEIREGEESRLRVGYLISEGNLAEKLHLAKKTFLKLRERGCPWLNFEGKVFYHEIDFVEWVLKNLPPYGVIKDDQEKNPDVHV